MLLHASCVAINGHGVLLTGPSGCGKSDLALRLIDAGAELVADDQVELHAAGEAIVATVPHALAGLIEIRHVGLMRLPYRASVPVALFVELGADPTTLERLPEARPFFLLDHPVRRLRLSGTYASTPAKIRAALLHPIVTDAL